MNNENEQAERPTEEKSCGSLIAMVRCKKFEERLSLDGKASMGEYWATFLLRWLPLALVSATIVAARACSTGNEKFLSMFYDFYGEDSKLVLLITEVFQTLASVFFTVANLEMFPVTVRRLRDAKVCVGLAAIMIPAGVFFTAVAVFYPWFACVSALILLVPGILPSRADADGDHTAGVATKTKMCYKAAWCFIIAAITLGIATEHFILKLRLEMAAEKLRSSYSEISQSNGSWGVVRKTAM